MSKKIKIIIMSIVSILLIVSIAFLFFYKNRNGVSGLDIMLNAFPFGVGEDDIRKGGVGVGDRGGITNIDPADRKLPRLFQIHETPIAGAFPLTIMTDEDKTTTSVRYLERGVGHIFETDISTMEEDRISNITRLKIYEALWGNDGKNVVIRYLDDDNSQTIRSFAIKLSDRVDEDIIPGEEIQIQKEPEVEGVFLPKNISDVALSHDSKKIFHIVDTGSIAIGTIYNFISGKSSQIFSSPFTEWLPQWPNKNTITLTTKPSGNVPGILYSLDVKTEEMTKELGNINGLTTLMSPSGEKVLYSESTKNGITLNLYNIKDRSSKRLPLTTLPEKCVWSKLNGDVAYCAVPISIQRGLYPDDWYQGTISFSDEIWLMDVESNRTTFIVNPMDSAREEMDMINLSTNEYEEFFFFTNKKDLSLWGTRLYIF